MTMVFNWLESKDYTQVCILRDSLSMIQNIEKGCVVSGLSLWEGQVSAKLHSSLFLDMLVLRKTKERIDWQTALFIRDGQPMDCADIVNNLMEIGRKEDFEKRESTSLLRMKDY
jgi:hypothetical protein